MNTSNYVRAAFDFNLGRISHKQAMDVSIANGRGHHYPSIFSANSAKIAHELAERELVDGELSIYETYWYDDQITEHKLDADSIRAAVVSAGNGDGYYYMCKLGSKRVFFPDLWAALKAQGWARLQGEIIEI